MKFLPGLSVLLIPVLCGVAGCTHSHGPSATDATTPSTLGSIHTSTTVPASPATDAGPFARTSNGN